MKLKKIHYSELNKRQIENYNFQKIASVLAEYGYSCMWLNDDWQGADFIANHIDGVEFIKVQLKGRLTIDTKYVGKNIFIAFRYQDDTYLYPHDEIMNLILKKKPSVKMSESWKKGLFSWNNPMTKALAQELEKYKI